jgi:hypothetical protein
MQDVQVEAHKYICKTILKDTDILYDKSIKNVEMNKFFNLVISLIIYQRDKNILEITRI